ncbi:putative hydrolase [Actibacterium atlanticum]|uniref:Putative hydrolase n=1 Tax=Actibacterium atlanticum TaxID=1461693 RepID=A0A058ZIK6_9RHOB|nr:dienelactone hydrolase family protein [Actibacterium atlanticum]KCV81449.1 putative hydrolase [Actibacterium atlanticum]
MKCLTRLNLVKVLRAASLGVAAMLTLGMSAAQLDAKVMERKISVGGTKRSYVLYLPDNLSARSSWPVIIAYHPALGTGQGMADITKLHQTAGDKFIVAYPDGFRRTFNAGDCCGVAEKRNIDDVGFFKAMMADIGSMAPVQSKAYLTGYSNGARMVYHLVCNVPEMVAAAAPFAATRNMDNCKSSRVPVLHIHGDADEGSPVDGGYAQSGLMKNSLGYMEPAQSVVSRIASRNGCASGGATISESGLGNSICKRYSTCSGGETILCVVPGLGHVWPGAPAGSKRFGPARPDLNGSRAVVNFFLRH